jgi:GxxExxY protein
VNSEALEKEFIKEKISYEKGKRLIVYYEGEPLKKFFKADFVCFDSIILEMKSAKFLTEADRQQALNYLKATKFKLALLINFGSSSLTYKRIIN